MKNIITLLFILTTSFCLGQTKIDHLIDNLKQPNFANVYEVKDSIINKEIEAIPKLIELLRDTSFVKLNNTADLIYPGTEKFYGHGLIVNYDIDWISVRSAWILEEITFQNFGYLENNINEDDLMEFYKKNHSSYSQIGSHSIDFKKQMSIHKLIFYRKILAENVSNWWESKKQKWSRINALKEALTSDDEERQLLALNYLSFSKTTCTGLTKSSFKKEIKPLVQQIELSKNSNAEHATLLLEDDEYYWLKIKK